MTTVVRVAKNGAKRSVKVASGLVDRVAPAPAGISVLIYHRVGGGSDSDVDLAPEVFERQLEHLRAHHRILTLDAALSELTAGATHGETGAGGIEIEPAVVLTFDDGTDDFVDVAVPLLVRYEVPATLYVATRFVDEGEAFPWGAPPATWQGLAQAASTGLVTVGSHTHTHRLLDKLDGSDVEDDLDTSIELIGEHIGIAPEHFAYPKAVPPGPAAEIAVRRRFASAALAGGRVIRPMSFDSSRLARIPVQASDSMEQFAAKAAGGMRLEGALRAAAARVRYRSAVT